MTEPGVHPRLLAEMLNEALCIGLDKTSSAEVWQSLLHKGERVLLKFNQADASLIGTSEVLATVLVESMLKAGIEPEQIVLLETSVEAPWSGQLTKPAWGWTGKVYDFGSAKDRLLKVLEQVDAIVNVPFLKAHRIARMTGCLKNLSHGLIQHPARYHANQCCPFIPDIVALPIIRAKLRLNIVNAVRIIYDVHPLSAKQAIRATGALIVSTDPVAADTVGHDLLDRVRLTRGLKPIAPQPGLIRQHVLAARKGLGTNNLESIDVVRPLPW